MPPVMFSVVTKYHKGRHSLFLYNSEIFYAFTQDILRSLILWLLMSVLGSSAVLAKILGQAGAIIGNFLFSKLYVFRNK
ncbi:hypothetical protein GU904_12090 [Lactiplantibacillus plantarum]